MISKLKKIDIKNFIKSFFYFITVLFRKKEYDVIFLTHRHFNRGENGENLFLKPFIEYADKNNLKYIIYEENSLDGKFNNFPRNHKAIPFDFVTFLQRIFRVILKEKNKDYNKYINFFNREKRVSNLLKAFIQKNKTNTFIVLAHNNIELVREVFQNSNIYDYQHGIIWDGHENVLENSEASEIKVLNNLNTILYGKSFKQLLINFDKTNYYSEKNLFDIGYYHKINDYKLRENNKTILYTLQNVDMDSYKPYYDSIIELLLNTKDYLIDNNYSIYIKNHPRYDKNQKLILPKELEFVSILPDNHNIKELFDNISIHLTSKSTTAFDMALNSVPTIFTDLIEVRSPILMFKRQYHYPFNELIIKNSSDLINALKLLENDDNFLNITKKTYSWAKNFYQDFDDNKLDSLLQIGNK